MGVHGAWGIAGWMWWGRGQPSLRVPGAGRQEKGGGQAVRDPDLMGDLETASLARWDEDHMYIFKGGSLLL